MAKRYIDADALAERIKASPLFRQGLDEYEMLQFVLTLVDGYATADVVPRETVEQIFAEIEKALNAFDGSWADTVIDTQCLIEELKKKYIGE